MGVDDRIRVVIVDDIAETRENIRKLLQFENDIEVVGVARTGIEGINVAKEMRPDVMLMDINMPDMDGIVATETIRRTIPHTQIVILSVQGDTNYMRRAMLAGARDFITKPPSIDDLTSAIRRAGKMAIDERSKAPVPARAGVPGVGVLSGSAMEKSSSIRFNTGSSRRVRRHSRFGISHTSTALPVTISYRTRERTMSFPCSTKCVTGSCH